MYAQAEVDRANDMLFDYDWDALLESNDVNQCINAWNQQFMHVMKTCIPKGTLQLNKNLPWVLADKELHSCNAQEKVAVQES